MNKRKRFIKNIGWLMSGRIINLFLQFFVSLATARYLGPSNLGTINYVAAYISFFSSISSLGLSVIVIKEIAADEHDSNEIIWTSIWMRFITAMLSEICIISLFLITNGNDPTIIKIAILESLSVIFSAFNSFDYYFQAKLLSKWSAVSGVLSYIGMSLYRIYLLVIGADIVWFALAYSVDIIFSAFFLMTFYVRIEGLRPKFNWDIGKKLLKQSVHYLVAGLITILYGKIDSIMLGNMLDNTSVGFYSVALTISSMWSIIPGVLIETISPILYETAKKDRIQYLKKLKQSYALIFWLNAMYSIFICIFAKWIILLLYGEEYLAATTALRIVVWYYGISTMSTLNQVYLANDNKNKYINIFCLVGLIVDVVLNALMIPKWGINGAAFATLITHITIQIIVPYIFKDTREIAIGIIQGACLIDVIGEEEIQILKNGLNKITKNKIKQDS